MEPRSDTHPGVTRRSLLRKGLATAAALGVSACSTDRGTAGPRGPVPPPEGMVRTSWSADPWTLGSYSFLGVGASPQLRATLGTPISDGTLHLAGEHVATDNPATVHGAAESGNRAADRILEDTDGSERIVVVGAGMAGATAARRLADEGHRVRVVEGRERVGGRLATVRPEGWGTPVELGASWVHDVLASDLADELAELGVRAVPFAGTESVLGPRGVEVPADAVSAGPERAIAAALEWAASQRGDVSLADAIRGSGTEVDPLELDRYVRSEIVTEYGADPDELSARNGMAEGTTGDDLLVVGGYGRLVEDLLDGIPTELAWPVATITHGGDGVLVTARDGRTITGDRAVVTLPLGVLKAGAVRFDPPLPDGHVAAIDGLSMGVLDKVWLRWDERWWDDHGQQWTRTAEPDDPFVEWFDLAGPTGQAVLLALVGGSTARAWTTRTDDEVLTAALGSLQSFRDAGW